MKHDEPIGLGGSSRWFQQLVGFATRVAQLVSSCFMEVSQVEIPLMITIIELYWTKCSGKGVKVTVTTGRIAISSWLLPGPSQARAGGKPQRQWCGHRAGWGGVGGNDVFFCNLVRGAQITPKSTSKNGETRLAIDFLKGILTPLRRRFRYDETGFLIFSIYRMLWHVMAIL